MSDLGKASVGRAGRLTVLRVSGSPYEQGFQHGRLLADRIPHGALSYFRKFLGLTIRNSEAPWLERPILWLLRERISKRLIRRMTPYTLELIRGLAEGSGSRYEDLLEVFTMPEAFIGLVGYWQKLARAAPVPQVAPFSAPVCGCTSAIATRSATADGKLYHARNFDYPAVGYWDQDPVVQFTTPDEGMPYMSLISSGVPAGGVTGMNASGISLVIHQHWLKDLDLDGVPVGIAGEAALRHATSLDEAVRIILEHPTVGGWTYLISDGKTGEALALEVAPGRHGIVRLGETGVRDALGYSNAYLSAELQRREVPLVEAYWKNCRSRLELSNRLLRQGHGRHTAESLATVLASGTEPSRGASQLFGNVIPMLLTVATVVFDPAEHTMWVSDGTVPACHGKFVPFRLEDQDVSREARAFETRGFGSRERDEAYRRYAEAYRAFFERGDAREALSALRRATELAPEAGELWSLRGFVALRALEAGDAAECLARALPLAHDAERAAEARLALGYAHDLRRERGEARRLYAEVARDEAASPRHRKAARLHGHLPFSARKARRLPIDFVFGSLL